MKYKYLAPMLIFVPLLLGCDNPFRFMQEQQKAMSDLQRQIETLKNEIQVKEELAPTNRYKFVDTKMFNDKGFPVNTGVLFDTATGNAWYLNYSKFLQGVVLEQIARLDYAEDGPSAYNLFLQVKRDALAAEVSKAKEIRKDETKVTK